MRRLTFVLGKRPRPGTVVASVIDLLRADGFDVTVHLPHDEPCPVPASALESDVVVQRGLRRPALLALLDIESAGVRCCNPIVATLAAADRLVLAERLSAAGIAVPITRAVASWADVRGAAAAGHVVVVKSRDASVGRGAAVAITLDGELPTIPAFQGPWVLQEHVPSDGRVHKFYVAGGSLRALVKPAPTTEPLHRASRMLRPPPHLVDVAVGTGAALGLDIYNVDVVLGPDGPRVVDVNPFPGFRGIPDAAGLVADHVQVLARAATSSHRACRTLDE